MNTFLDEFDTHFNKVAIASMKYHMNDSVAGCSSSLKEIYEDLIERLSKNPRDYPYSDTENKHRANCYKGLNRSKAKEKAHDMGLTGREQLEFLQEARSSHCVECDEIKAKRHDYELQTREEITQARKDFVEIIPSLWS